VICQSDRLLLRLTRLDDAAFLLRIVNQASWIRHIGDRKVRTLEDAERYVDTRMLEPVRKHGFGMYVIELKATGEAIGLCGLVKRDTLPDPDLGFALLDEHAGHGYALEAAAAMLGHARDALKLPRLLAITSPANARSEQLLGKLGFRLDGAPHVNPEGEHLNLWSRCFGP
jgi:RimJ/RimL family protein N-acetyltransferase